MRLRTLILSGLLLSLSCGMVFAKTSVPSYGYDWIRISGKPLHVERVENYVYTNVQQLDRTSPYSYEQRMLQHFGGTMDDRGQIRFYAYGKRSPEEIAAVEQHNGIFDFTQYATEDDYPFGAPSSPYPNDTSNAPTPSLPYTENHALNGPETGFTPETMKPPVVTTKPENPKPPVVTPETPKPPVVTPEPETPKPPVVTPEPEPEQPPVTSSVSAWEREVWSLTNVERKKAGLSAFTLDSKLSTVARTKSQDMRLNGYFDHTSPTYGSPFDMMRQFDIAFSMAAENIAYGQPSPQEVVTAWMNSSGHRANILNPDYTHLGVGHDTNGNYWTQMFIRK